MDSVFSDDGISSIAKDRMREADMITTARSGWPEEERVDLAALVSKMDRRTRYLREDLEERMLRTMGVKHPAINYTYKEESAEADFGGSIMRWNLHTTEDRFRRLERLMRVDKFDIERWDDWFYWHSQTTVHEGTHKPDTIRKHTHHRDPTVWLGFAMRMGENIDALLFDSPAPIEEVQRMRQRRLSGKAGKGPKSSSAGEAINTLLTHRQLDSAA